LKPDDGLNQRIQARIELCAGRAAVVSQAGEIWIKAMMSKNFNFIPKSTGQFAGVYVP
jgi:hypothetical protein